jgi:RNA polymerase sigma-70 factor (ECF subfamily)
MSVHAALHALAPGDAGHDDAQVGRLEVSEADTATFHAARPRLFGIAYRILGNTVDAEDVVQDTWIRWQSTDRTKVRDASPFLATTTRRLAINLTQSARARHETHVGTWLVEPADAGADPALDVERAEALDLAVLTLLEKLSSTERAAYLLREAFEYPYKRISHVLAVSEINARQLVTRARSRLSGDRRSAITPGAQQQLLDAFVVAAQTGDLARLERTLIADMVRRPRGTDCSRTARNSAAEPRDDAHLPIAIAA